jgi:hypothetical protein
MHANAATVKHVPEWFPGASFQKTAKIWAKTLADTVENPFQFVKRQMVRSFLQWYVIHAYRHIYQAAGTAEVSFVSKLLEDPNVTPETELDIKWSAASLYTGGADTVSTTLVIST